MQVREENFRFAIGPNTFFFLIVFAFKTILEASRPLCASGHGAAEAL